MNPLFQMMGNPVANNLNNMIGTISQFKNFMSGKNPDTLVQVLAQKNPQFAQFLKANQGKSPQQIASENGIDWDSLRNMMK
jgi:hypothetical protein